MNKKFDSLKKFLEGEGKLAVAFSGGVDSTFLLQFAFEVLGNENVLALTMDSPTLPPDELEYACSFCEQRGIVHKIIDGSDIMQTPAYRQNPMDRCYYCKTHTFTQLLNHSQGMSLADGTNFDDTDDYRPGLKALEEQKIISPLRDAGLTKAEIREGLHARDIEIWDKPACACLASRIPYGEAVTSEKMSMVFKVESALHDMGLSQVRVRHHGDVARIEVLPEERRIFYDDETMDKIDAIAKDAGFKFAALDLAGYKMGNLNN